MKIQQENHVRTGSISGTTVKSRLNEARMGMILDMLAKKYNHPHTAVLREYVSNAYDSHNDAGVTRPVEVTLPTDFYPELIVRDFGLGMSKEEIIDIYSGFGFSTKDNDDTNIGGFGIGSKSALAISNQFSVISVKDGFKNMLIATREDGNIIYKFAVEDAPTDEGNGVTVTIPIRRASDYHTDTVVSVLNCWKVSEVFVTNNKEANIRIADKWIETDNGYIDPEIFVSSSYSRNKNYGLTVGPVFYPIPSGLLFHSSYKLRNIAPYVIPKLKISEVKVSSSREVLEQTNDNEKIIISKFEALHKDIMQIFDKKLADCESMKDAVLLNFSLARRLGSNKSITFRGEPVPIEVPANGVRNLRISLGGSSKSGYMIRIDNHELNKLYLNTDSIIAIEADENISVDILRRSIHNIFIASKNNKEIPANADITEVKDAIYGNNFNSLLNIEKVFKATDIVSAGNDLREKPVKGEKKVRCGRDNDTGNRSITMIEYNDQKYNPFKTIQTNLKAVQGKKNVIIFKRDNDNELSSIIHSKINGVSGHLHLIKTLLKNMPMEDRPVFIAVPSNVKSLDPYLNYVEGSVNAGNTWATDKLKEVATEISKKTNGKSNEIFRSMNTVSLLNAVREGMITGLLDEKVQKFINDTKVMLDAFKRAPNHIASLMDIHLFESSKDPMFALYAGFGAQRYITCRDSDDNRTKVIVEYINREMLDILA